MQLRQSFWSKLNFTICTQLWSRGRGPDSRQIILESSSRVTTRMAPEQQSGRFQLWAWQNDWAASSTPMQTVKPEQTGFRLGRGGYKKQRLIKKKVLHSKDPSFSSSLSVCAHLHQVSGDLCSSRSEGSSKIESWTSCGQVFLCCWLISVSSFRDTGGAALAFNLQPFQVLCQLMESSTEACHLKNRSLGIPKIVMPLYSHDELVTWDYTS